MSLNNISNAEEYSFEEMNQETFKFLHHKVASLIKMMVVKKVMMAYIHWALITCLELEQALSLSIFAACEVATIIINSISRKKKRTEK